VFLAKCLEIASGFNARYLGWRLVCHQFTSISSLPKAHTDSLPLPYPVLFGFTGNQKLKNWSPMENSIPIFLTRPLCFVFFAGLLIQPQAPNR
jgi:hypothetical protein